MSVCRFNVCVDVRWPDSMGVGRGYLIGAPQSDVIVNNAYSGVQSIVFMNSDTEIHANISAGYLVNKNKWIFRVESMNIAYGTAASPTYGGKYFVMVTQGSATTGIPCSVSANCFFGNWRFSFLRGCILVLSFGVASLWVRASVDEE